MDYSRWEDACNDSEYVCACSDLCVESFKAFVQLTFKYVFRKKFVWDELHDTMAKWLMVIWTGKHQNIVENIPPRYGKTELVVLFCAWAYGHNPACEFLHLSFSDSLAKRNSLRIKEVMRSDFYKAVFSTRIDKTKDAADDWNTTGGGRFGARPTRGQVTGFGAGATDEFDSYGDFVFSGMIWIDDPLKPSDAHTVERGKVNDHWHETIKSRRNSPRTTPTLCTMQRIHEGDFTAELIADTAENFKCVKLQALRDNGTALWPFKHDVQALEAMRDSNIFVFSSQYQQEPTAKGGSIFKDDWWQYCVEFPEFKRVELFADTALKTKEHNDFSVFQAWGLHEGKVYLIDQIRGKWEAPELLRVATAFIKRMKSQYSRTHKINIEDKASGTGLIQSLKRDSMITIKPVQRNTDKVTRAYDAAPHIQSGNVVLLNGAPYVDLFVSECSSFNAEDTHLHDDQVDTMMDAVSCMLDDNSGDFGVVMF